MNPNQQSLNDDLKNKVHLLTNQLDEMTDAYHQVNQQYQNQLQQNQRLQAQLRDTNENPQVQALAEALKQKSIEAEEWKSKYNRLEHITLRDYDMKVEKLIQEIEKLHSIVERKNYEIQQNRALFNEKLQEIEQERRKAIEMQSVIQEVNRERLHAINEYNNKAKEIEGLYIQLQQAEMFKNINKQLEMEIETIRHNYSTLFEKKEQDQQNFTFQLQQQKDLYLNQLQVYTQNTDAQHREYLDQIQLLNNQLNSSKTDLDKYFHLYEEEKVKNRELENNIILLQHQQQRQQGRPIISNSNSQSSKNLIQPITQQELTSNLLIVPTVHAAYANNNNSNVNQNSSSSDVRQAGRDTSNLVDIQQTLVQSEKRVQALMNQLNQIKRQNNA